jgi:TPR repeat protein
MSSRAAGAVLFLALVGSSAASAKPAHHGKPAATAPDGCEWRSSPAAGAQPSLFCRNAAGEWIQPEITAGFDRHTASRALGGDKDTMFAMALFEAMRDNHEKRPQPGAGISWLRKASDAGQVQAIMFLAVLYSDGQLLPKDDAEAVRLTRRAVALGDPLAIFNLGAAYLEGRGVPKDRVEGIRLYRQAADKGVPIAMYSLGKLYETGEGVPQDGKEALRWYQQAVDHNGLMTLVDMAEIYRYGRAGVPKNDAEAIRLYRAAAADGNRLAIQALQEMGASYP